MRHQPSLPNKTPFVPLFFSLAWVTSVSVGLACWPLSLSLAHSSPLAPKLVVDHWIYALKRRGERRSKAPRSCAGLCVYVHWRRRHAMSLPPRRRRRRASEESGAYRRSAPKRGKGRGGEARTRRPSERRKAPLFCERRARVTA